MNSQTKKKKIGAAGVPKNRDPSHSPTITTPMVRNSTDPIVTINPKPVPVKFLGFDAQNGGLKESIKDEIEEQRNTDKIEEEDIPQDMNGDSTLRGSINTEKKEQPEKPKVNAPITPPTQKEVIPSH